MTRRQLLGGLAATFSPKLFAFPLDRPVGVQLYTVRNLLPTKGEATLRAIAAMGYTEVEITLPDLRTFGPLLKKIGLTPTGAHVDGTTVALYPQKMAEYIYVAKSLGMPALGLAYIPPAERFDGKTFWPKFVPLINAAGEQCKKAGIQLYYHHHNFEFDPRFNAMELLHAKLSKDVLLEIDCFWASVGGMSVYQFIEHWNGRIFALHLKDKAKGVENSYETNMVKPTEFLEVGSGVIDWLKVIEAAKNAGVKHYYVEQDATPGDPLVSLKKSIDYLRK